MGSHHRFKLAGVVFILIALVAGCVKPIGLAPVPASAPTATPTFTPTLTPGCQTSGFTALTGGGTLGSLTPGGIPTPTPIATPTWAWTGALPPHPGGVFLLQTAADWNQFVAGSYTPGAVVPIPFNPATQALVVMGTEGQCPDNFNLTSVCNNGAQITIQVDEFAPCCPTVFVIPGIYNTTGFQAFVVDKFGLPVILNHLFHPWVGPLCV